PWSERSRTAISSAACATSWPRGPTNSPAPGRSPPGLSPPGSFHRLQDFHQLLAWEIGRFDLQQHFGLPALALEVAGHLPIGFLRVASFPLGDHELGRLIVNGRLEFLRLLDDHVFVLVRIVFV